MKHRRINYLSASIVTLLAFLFRLFLLWGSYYSLVVYNEEAGAADKLPISNVLNIESLFPPVILLAEAVLYVVLRKRFFQRRLIRSHVWTTVVSSILFPVAQIIIIDVFLRRIYAPVEIARYDKFVFYSGWILFAIARLFFITAMAKSVTSLNEQKKQDESTGFLDDFAQ